MSVNVAFHEEPSKSPHRVLAVTMGDLAGVGPEIVAKALLSGKWKNSARFLIVGDEKVLDRTCEKLKIRARPKRWDGQSDLRAMVPGFYMVSRTDVDPKDVKMGVVDRRWGRASLEYVQYAARLAMAGRVDGIVTAPISKEAVHLAGYPYEGHTDFLAHLTGDKDVRMMFLGPKMRVILVTVHMALCKVPEILSTDLVFQTIRLGGQALRKLGTQTPRIVVCGLNPHAGEAGAFGKEDRQKIQPAVLAACRLGWQVTGPVSSDSFFHRALSGQWDVDLIVAMYHDQGLIPFKMLHFDRGVNTTVGLSFVRTSPDHGTAYDIAGKGIADPTSMREAIRWALVMSRPVQGHPASKKLR